MPSSISSKSIILALREYYNAKDRYNIFKFETNVTIDLDVEKNKQKGACNKSPLEKYIFAPIANCCCRFCLYKCKCHVQTTAHLKQYNWEDTPLCWQDFAKRPEHTTAFIASRKALERGSWIIISMLLNVLTCILISKLLFTEILYTIIHSENKFLILLVIIHYW